MFTGLLPEEFVVEVGDPREPAPELLAPELPLIARAAEKRRREFAKGRQCARAALDRIGIHGFALLAGPQREPLWPPGVVGSITHVDCLCAVAVGPRERYNGVGIDVEYARILDAAITERIVFPADNVSAAFAALALAPALIFSAKEAFYKCQFCVSEQFLNFHDVAIDIASDGTFSAELRVDAGPLARRTRANGRWREHAGLFFTAISSAIHHDKDGGRRSEPAHHSHWPAQSQKVEPDRSESTPPTQHAPAQPHIKG
ncbi:MAG: 4'-phosphopantetheinyl transferase superfamily protein [Polyangiaceae bacterium]